MRVLIFTTDKDFLGFSKYLPIILHEISRNNPSKLKQRHQ
jgi:hypothetical protein